MNKRQGLGTMGLGWITVSILFLIALLFCGFGYASAEKESPQSNAEKTVTDSQPPSSENATASKDAADSKIVEFQKETSDPNNVSDDSSQTNVDDEGTSHEDISTEGELSSDGMAASSLSDDEGVARGNDNLISEDLALNQLSVTAGGNTGAAVTGIPIIVPPGRKGMQPNLSLAYNSNRGNGWIGVGWGLDMGSIQRSAKRGVNYSADDYVVSMGGSVSELTPRGDWGTNYYYGAKIEGAFSKYYKNPSGGWIVTTKDGTKYYYGTTPASRQDNAFGVFKWCLDRVEDTNGNYMTITYWKDYANGEIYLYRIDYTGNTAGLSPTNYVIFYTDGSRTDAPEMYTTNSAVKTAYMLQTIEVYGNGQLARRYELSYENYTNSYRSLLTEVTLHDSDGMESLSIYLEQYVSISSFNPISSSGTDFGKDAGWTDNNTKPRYMADVNGDGLADIVGFKSDGVYVSLYDDCGSFSPAELWVADYGTAFGWLDNKTYPRIMADVNGDGLSDIVGFKNDGVYVSLSNGYSQNSFTPAVRWIADYGTNLGWTNNDTFPRYMTDVNGDGKADIVGFKDAGVYVSLAQGNNTFSGAELWVADYSTVLGWLDNKTYPRIMADVNGDGLSDIVGFKNDGVYVSLSNGYTQNSFTPAVQWVSGYGCDGGWTDNNEHPRYLADVNGDGKADVVGFGVDGVHVSLSTGNSFTAYTQPWVTGYNWGSNVLHPRYMADVNGDGRDDIVGISYNSIYVSISKGDYFTASAVWGYTWLTARDYIPHYVTDINGDGKADILRFSEYGSDISIVEGSGPIDLLSRVVNFIGGVTNISYKRSSGYLNTYLPFLVQTVSSVEVSNAYNATDPWSVTNYDYAGGFYDVIDREFRGFSNITKTEPNSTYTETDFYIDHLHNYYKGLPKEQTTYDSQGKVYNRTTYLYDVGHPYTGVDFPTLTRKDDYIFDGITTDKYAISSARQIASEFRYDYYGNITSKYFYGDAGIQGDEKYEYTNYTYDTANWIVSLPKTAYILDGNGWTAAQRWYAYYPNTTNLYTVESWNDTGANPVTVYEYDRYGNPKKIRDPRGNLTKITYDATMNAYPWKVENALGHVVEKTYDYRYGKVKKEIDPNQNETNYEYDGFGRTKRVIKPAPYGITEYYYISFGDPGNQRVKEEAQDRTGAVIHWKESYFDGRGLTIKEMSGGPGATSVIVNTSHDVQGLIYWKSYPRYVGGYAYGTTYWYDPVNRLKQTDYPDGTSASISYDRGRITYIDANGHKKVAEKDAYGRIEKIEEHTGSGVSNPYALYAETLYWYDVLDNLEYVRDAQGNETYITYDSLSRKASIYDPDMGLWEYEYDLNGNLISQTDQMDRTIMFQYDKLNRVTLKDYPTGVDITYVYDEASSSNSKGRMTTVTDSAGTTVFNYDSLGQITRSDKTLSLDSSTYTTQTQYDPLGRVEHIIYPDNAVVDYSYDGNGNIYQIKSGAASYVTYNSYTALGQPLLITFDNRVTTQYQYYPQNNRLKTIYSTNGTTPLMNLEYFYDYVGNITLLTDYLDSNKTRNYKYDDLDRLIEADSPSYEGKLIYQYDRIGNMTYNCRYGHYYYEDVNHVHAVTKVVDSNGTIVNSYAYDGNGNMTSGAGRTLTYDYDNRPTSITYNGKAVVNVYDVNGSRVHKMLSSPIADITTYIGQLYECSSSMGECTKYIFAGSQRIAQVKTLGADVDTYYYHTDHLLSSSIITAGDDVEENPAGDKLEDIHYYPFGEIHTNSGSVNVRHKFAGHEFDAETGLIYMGARYYDPKLARFITADPVVPARVDQHNFLSFKVRQDLTNPQRLNRYSYCGNNPVILRDPFGLDWKDYVRTGWDNFIVPYGSLIPGTPGIPFRAYDNASNGYAAGIHIINFVVGKESGTEAACRGLLPGLGVLNTVILGKFSKGLETIGSAFLKSIGMTKGVIDANDPDKCTEILGTNPANFNQVSGEKSPATSETVTTNPPTIKNSGSENPGGGALNEVNQPSKSSDLGSQDTSPEGINNNSNKDGHNLPGGFSSPGSNTSAPGQSSPTYNGNTDANGGIPC